MLAAALQYGYANDDHPPADVRRGQNLVARVYNELRQSKYWDRTLFVVTYDEHGGFFDHEPPPLAVSPDGSDAFRRLGPRVPALLVSPLVSRGSVDSTLRDHTTLVKTILRRFARDAPDDVADMGARVAQSPDLGSVLSEDVPRSGCPIAQETAVVEFSTQRLFFRRTKADDATARPRDPGELQATSMQEEMLQLAEDARAAGVLDEDL